MKTHEDLNRKRLKAHYKACAENFRQWQERDYQDPAPETPPLPDDLHDFHCGARTQAGTPCKQKAIYNNSRCKWHGELSTGPKTEAGIQQSRINGAKGGRPKKTRPYNATATARLFHEGIIDIRSSHRYANFGTFGHAFEECCLRQSTSSRKGKPQIRPVTSS